MARHRQSAQTFDDPPPCAIGQILQTPLSLPTNFLEDTVPNLTASRVHFEPNTTPESREPYISIVDNVLTLDECSTLIDAIRARSETAWETIVGNDNGDGQGFLTDNRKCRRIMWDSPELAAKVWNRMNCAVPEVQRLSQWPEVTGPPESMSGGGEREVWRMVRLNERMRFMRYSRGEFFKRSFFPIFFFPPPFPIQRLAKMISSLLKFYIPSSLRLLVRNAGPQAAIFLYPASHFEWSRWP